VPGGRELLEAAGFKPDGTGFLQLGDEAGLAGVRAVLAAMTRPRVPKALEAAPPQLAATPAAPAPATPQHLQAAVNGTGSLRKEATAMDVDGAGVEDEDDELARAISMSMGGAGPSAPPPPPTVPTPAAEEVTLESAIKKHFAAFTGQGMAPNDAAVRALAEAQKDVAAAQAAARTREAHAGAKRARDGADDGGGTSAGEAEGAPADVEFRRFEAEGVVTAAEQIHEIDAFFAATGMTFVDPSFPPGPRSLYHSEASASQWKCPDCHKYNPLPSLPPVAQMFGPQGAALRERHKLKCAHCGADAPVEYTLSRPSGWLSATQDSVRDDVTFQFVDSVPWTVFREEPRPDDIRQGALGDCWFVCALSMLAEEPALVRRIFSPDGDEAHARAVFSKAGAYMLRLCRAGEWHTVVVDDHFPSTELQTFAYSKAARRQLWVPLCEKAAAKLHGCYEALEAGTLAEALTMLTGYATERILLFRYRSLDDLDLELAAADPARAEALANLTPEQRTARDKQREEEMAEREYADTDELFLGLLSRKASGFVMGAACVDRRAREMGLQAPHAYGVLELTEVEGGGGETVRIVKLRNPSGVSQWSGAWGPKSSLWTPEARAALGVDREDAGTFWMSFEDFVRFFASVEVCRVRPPRFQEVRTRGWLASAFGAGEAMAVNSFARTELDVAIYQEGHSDRGGTGARTLLDLGMLVVKTGAVDDDAGSAGDLQVVGFAKRAVSEQAFLTTTLEQDSHEGKFLIIPLCFNQLASTEPRRFVAAAHSSQPLLLQPTKLSPRDVSSALLRLATVHGTPTWIGPICVSAWKDDAGTIVVAENSSERTMRVDLDCSSSVNMLSSRGALFCEDVLLPRSRMVLMVITAKAGARDVRFGMGMGCAPAEGEGHIPPIEPEAAPNSVLHMPEPIPAARVAELRRTVPASPAPAGLDINNLSAALAATFQQHMANRGGGNARGGPPPGGAGNGPSTE